MERIEGHDPSGDGIEGPSPSEYAHELLSSFQMNFWADHQAPSLLVFLCCFLLFVIYNQTSFLKLCVKLF